MARSRQVPFIRLSFSNLAVRSIRWGIPPSHRASFRSHLGLSHWATNSLCLTGTSTRLEALIWLKTQIITKVEPVSTLTSRQRLRPRTLSTLSSSPHHRTTKIAVPVASRGWSNLKAATARISCNRNVIRAIWAATRWIRTCKRSRASS